MKGGGKGRLEELRNGIWGGFQLTSKAWAQIQNQ